MGVTVKDMRQAAITGGGPTQDFTISGFGTPKAAMFFCTRGVTDGAQADHAVVSVGMTNGVNHVVTGFGSEHNLPTSDAYRLGASNEVVLLTDLAGAIDGEANFDSWITDGVRINWGNLPAGAYLLTVVLFEGTDLSVDIGTFTQPAGDTNTVDVATGSEPDQILTLGNGAGFSTDGSSAAVIWLGLASNNVSIEQACMAWTSQDNASTSNPFAHIKDDRIAINPRAAGTPPDISRAAELTAFNAGPTPAAGFTTTTRDTNDSFTFTVGYMALNYNGAVSHSVELVDSPTSTGDDAQTGPGFTPQFVLEMQTLVQAYGTGESDADAELQGISVSDGTSSFCNTWVDEDAETTTNTKSQSDNVAVNLKRADGTQVMLTGVTSMTASGWTRNFSTADGTTRKWAALVIGTPPLLQESITPLLPTRIAP